MLRQTSFDNDPVLLLARAEAAARKATEMALADVGLMDQILVGATRAARRLQQIQGFTPDEPRV